MPENGPRHGLSRCGRSGRQSRAREAAQDFGRPYSSQPISDDPFFRDFDAMLADYEQYRRFDDIGTSVTHW